MDRLALTAVLLSWIASIAGVVMLCHAIEVRNRKEARRELYALSPGRASWP